MEKLRKISDAVNRVVAYLAAAIFVVLIVACVMQVFFRFVLNNSLSWTEELARYCFIWMHLIGASLLCQKNEHATVTLFLDMVHGKAAHLLGLVIELVILFDGGFMLVYGSQLAYASRGNLSAALSANMALVNSSVAVGGALLMFQAIMKIATHLCEIKQAAKGGAVE